VPYLIVKKKVFFLVLEQRKVGKKRSYFKELEQVWVVRVVESKKQEDQKRGNVGQFIEKGTSLVRHG
jgi:hypothetical protein